jgi:hypothetical protein
MGPVRSPQASAEVAGDPELNLTAAPAHKNFALLLERRKG